jgi:hypothetical protein
MCGANFSLDLDQGAKVALTTYTAVNFSFAGPHRETLAPCSTRSPTEPSNHPPGLVRTLVIP